MTDQRIETLSFDCGDLFAVVNIWGQTVSILLTNCPCLSKFDQQKWAVRLARKKLRGER